MSLRSLCLQLLISVALGAAWGACVMALALALGWNGA